MTNKFYSEVSPTKLTGGEGGTNEPAGESGSQESLPSMSMPQKTAAWPGLPGKTGPNRSNGVPTAGYSGPFRNKAEGI